MSTIKSSAENLTLNADGANNDIKFQSNGSEVASIDQAGVMTATSFAGSGAALTGVGVAGITSAADATAITITSAERVGIQQTAPPALLGLGQDSGSGDSAASSGITFKTSNNDDMFQLSTVGGANNDARGLKFSADGTERMRMSASGHVTMPSQPCAFVNGGGTSYIQVNDGSPAPFSNIEHQTGGSNYNTSNYRYTAPVAGWYQVSFGILAGSNITQEWMLNKNGTHVFRCYAIDRSWYCTGIFHCSASDYLEVVSGGSNSGNLYANTGANTYSWATYRLLG
jgi:hypothetical protein